MLCDKKDLSFLKLDCNNSNNFDSLITFNHRNYNLLNQESKFFLNVFKKKPTLQMKALLFINIKHI